MNKILEQIHFLTTDMALAGTIVAVGYPLDHLENLDQKKVTFVFRKEPNLDAIVQSFWNDSLTVNPKRYFYALKEIKSRLYNEK